MKNNGHTNNLQQAILAQSVGGIPPSQPQPPFNVGPLMSLDQLICITAANLPTACSDPEGAVKSACEIVSQSIKHAMIGTIGRRVEELKKAHLEANKESRISTETENN